MLSQSTERSKDSGKRRYIPILLCLFLVGILGSIVINEALAQQGNESAWIWKVSTDNPMPHYYVYPLDNNSTVRCYITTPPDTHITSANIEVSSNFSTNNGKILVPIPSETLKRQNDPQNRTFYGYKVIRLDHNFSDPSSNGLYPVRVYDVKITATGENLSNPNNHNIIREVHVIEMNITDTGTLIVKKVVPEGSTLKGWKFTVNSPEQKRTSQYTNPNLAEYMAINKTSNPTDMKGLTEILNLTPRSGYIINETLDPKSGWLVNASQVLVDVSSGKEKSVAFKNTPNTLKIIKFEDKNGNGLMDPGETGLQGWKFTVTDPSGFKRVVETGIDGSVTISELKSGVYHVSEETKEGWCSTTSSDSTISFTNGEDKQLVFGNSRTGTLKINKQDPDGKPLSGWTFMINGQETTSTGSDGSVTVELCPGSYSIQEKISPEKYSAGWRKITPDMDNVIVQSGQTTERTFINWLSVPIKINKFEDLNKNGQRDGNEMGLTGWTFTAYDKNGNKIKTSESTDSTGNTTITELQPGDYVVKEDPLSKPGWVSTTKDMQNVKVASGMGAVVSFGNKPNTLAISVFNDANQNGKRDRGASGQLAETGLQNWNFNVNGPSGMASQTDAYGNKTISELIPGNYTINAETQNGWINTNSTVQKVSIKAGEDMHVAFGYIKASSVNITKFNDTNRNGKRDAGENGLQSWSFTVSDAQGNVVNTSNPTDNRGITEIIGLRSGNYTIKENPISKPGWISTTPDVQNIHLSAGEVGYLDFGNVLCPECERIDHATSNYSEDNYLQVTKDASDILVGQNGVVNYTIKICPRVAIGSEPTDLVIAVDSSSSIVNNITNGSVLTRNGINELLTQLEEKDKSKVFRVGIVEWSEKHKSSVLVPLTSNYTYLRAKVDAITFMGNTSYQEGINAAVNAFSATNSRVNSSQKIVFITDARDDGYESPTNYPGPEYTIHAIVIGESRRTMAYQMLDNLTKQHNGRVSSLGDITALGSELTRIVSGKGELRKINLTETLPNYLVLRNYTVKEGGHISLNRESNDWSTTTIQWDGIDLLSGCWSTTFQAVFCWKLPADVKQGTAKQVSEVNYITSGGIARSLALPEHELRIVTGSAIERQLVAPGASETKKQPGFELWVAMGGIMAMVYILRRRK